MLHSIMSNRDLVRRWYSQIQSQSEKTVTNLRNLVAHTIIPSNLNQFTFPADFVPQSQLLDVVLHSELNTADQVVGLTLRAYRSSFDGEQLYIGGGNNFVLMKQIEMRPFKTATGRVLNPESEPSLLLSALEMDSERLAAFQFPGLRRPPRFAPLVAAFLPNEELPHYDITTGLLQMAWESLLPNALPLSALQAPAENDGVKTTSVKSIVHNRRLGVSLIELNNFWVLELPSFAQVHVRSGQPISAGQILASVTLSSNVMQPFAAASENVFERWSNIVSYISEQTASWLLRTVYDSAVTKWSSMTMIPHFLLRPDQFGKKATLWRDLRASLVRSCHNFTVCDRIVRVGQREGGISVWEHKDPSDQSSLQFKLNGGSAELFSTPFGLPPRRTFYGAPIVTSPPRCHDNI